MSHDPERNPIIVADVAALSAIAESIPRDHLQGWGLTLTDVLAIENDGSTALDWFYRAGGTIAWTPDGWMLDPNRQEEVSLDFQVRYERYQKPRPSHRAVRFFVESFEPDEVDAVTVVYADPSILLMLRAADVPIEPLTVEQFVTSRRKLNW